MWIGLIDRDLEGIWYWINFCKELNFIDWFLLEFLGGISEIYVVLSLILKKWFDVLINFKVIIFCEI